jgi:hypothetical protein
MGQGAGRERLERALERPWVDYLGAGLVTAALLLAAEKWAAVDALGHLSDAQRVDLYGRLVAPLSIVASIATAGLAVYASASGPTMTLLRSVYGDRVLKQFRGAAVSAGLAVVVLIGAYIAQTGYAADWFRWFVVAIAAFVILRTIRVLYFYSNVLRVIDEDKVPPKPRPSIDRPARRRANA